jgi:hypothetical protein
MVDCEFHADFGLLVGDVGEHGIVGDKTGLTPRIWHGDQVKSAAHLLIQAPEGESFDILDQYGFPGY